MNVINGFAYSTTSLDGNLTMAEHRERLDDFLESYENGDVYSDQYYAVTPFQVAIVRNAFDN